MRVLNVGGGTIPVPPMYAGWDVDLLDIDPACGPTLLMDAREMMLLPGDDYDAVYCSHNLEHYYEHELPGVLAGFIHVLKDNGFADIHVPDALSVIAAVFQRGLDLDSVLYTSSVGPIRVGDVLWGYQKEIRESGQSWFGHRFGFSRATLGRALKAAGFETIVIGGAHYELRALAFKQKQTKADLQQIGVTYDQERIS